MESTLNFEHFEKNERHSSNISEVIDSERRAYLNPYKGLVSENLLAVNVLNSGTPNSGTSNSPTLNSATWK